MDWVNDLLRRILFLPEQASTVAREVDQLHYFVIIVTMLGAVGITIAGFWLLWRYRARGPAFKPEDPAASPPVWAELLVVAGLLGLFCLWWVLGFVQYVRLQVAPEDAMDVYVTGKQWMWKFAYSDGQHTIATLYVPTGRPVRLLLTSRDVIHSFYVPQFRIKYDAIPGRYTTAWFTVREPGTYLVLCTEYCGVGHSTMRGQVIALSPADYSRWVGGARGGAEVPGPRLLAGAPEGPGDQPFPSVAGPRDLSPLSVEEFPPREPLVLARLGEQVAAQQGCLRCHTLDGAAHIGPTWAGLYRSMVPLRGGGEVLADPAYLTESMMEPLAKVHRGFAPVMPSYHGLLTPADVSALVELIRALRTLPGRQPVPAPLPLDAGASPAAEGGR